MARLVRGLVHGIDRTMADMEEVQPAGMFLPRQVHRLLHDQRGSVRVVDGSENRVRAEAL
jgi:hypothetical protein